ncbi:MAG: class I adenylate-forming enzyme family protein, partial [Raoultibacter sp.]
MQSFIQDLGCFNARRDSRAEAVLDWDAGIRYTWGDLQACAQKLAVFFTREQGLSKGDRVGFLCQNTVVMIASYYASLATGIVITAYNYRLNEQDLISIVEEESPSILFFTKESEEKASRLQKICAASFLLVSVDEGCQVDAFLLSDIMKTDLDEGFLPAEVSEEDPAMLAHTGGTTGRPKAAILSHRSIFLNAVSELVSMHVNDRDCAYVCMPFFHTGGWNVFTLPLLLAGGRIVLTREFSPELFFEIAEKEKPTVCMAADMMYQSLVKHPLFQESDLTCFRWVIGGASAISESSMRPFWDKGVRFFTGYGMT